MFQTEKEPGLNGRALDYPRGKVIGGCSAINAMISMRGQSADYDHWRQLGLTGWGWDDVLPVFKRLDDHFLGDTEHHGAGGEWRVERPRVKWDVLNAVEKAATSKTCPSRLQKKKRQLPGILLDSSSFCMFPKSLKATCKTMSGSPCSPSPSPMSSRP